MDSYSEHSGEFDLEAAEAVSATNDVTDAIGADERRMHVRAYNYWVSLLMEEIIRLSRSRAKA